MHLPNLYNVASYNPAQGHNLFLDSHGDSATATIK